MANINWPNPTFVGQTYVSDNGDSWRWTGQYWQSIGTSAIGGTGATGQVTIWSGTSSITGSPRITYTDVAGSNVKITISDSGYGSVLGRGFVDTSVNNGGATNVIRSASNTNGIASVIELKKARNTISVPNTLTSGTYLGEVQYTGAYDGLGGYRTSSTIRSEASELWSSTASGTKLSINTISNTTTTLTERFSIEGNGLIRFYGAYTFPNSNGTVGQVLTTSGAGTLSWSTISAASLGAVGGSGAPNYLTKWTTGGTTLVNSQILDDGSAIGIGQSPTPTTRLSVTSTLSYGLGVSMSNSGTVATQFYATNGGGNLAIDAQSGGGTTTTNVGIRSTVTGGATRYAIHLMDGTQAAGRFLKSITADGRANWANITAADVSGILTGSGTDGQMAIWNSSGALTGSNYIAYDLTSLNVGITLTDPGLTNAYTNIRAGSIELNNENAINVNYITINSTVNSFSSIILTKRRGTSNAPLPLISGDTIGEYIWRGSWNNSGSGVYRSAYIQANATENWSTSGRGTGIKIATTSNGIVTPLVRFEILGTGQIKFNSAYTFPSSAALSANSLLLSDASGILSWGTTNALSISTGTGTADYVTRWTGTNTQGIGIIRDNLTTVGINTDPALYTTSRLVINETLNQKVPFKIDYTTPTNSGTSVSNVGANITVQCANSGQPGSFTALELRASNAQGSNVGLNIGIQGTNSLGFQTNVGILNHIGTSFPSMGTSVNNYGIYTNVETQNSTNPVIGGYFTVATNSGTGGRYALQLIDGTQTTLGGKFLKDVGGGKANWASLTAADVSGVVSGAGANNYLALWSSGTNITYNTAFAYNSTARNISVIGATSASTSVLGSDNIQISSSISQPLLTMISQSGNGIDGNGNYSIIRLNRYTLAGGSNPDGTPLGSLNFNNSGNDSARIVAISVGPHSTTSNHGSQLTIDTVSRGTTGMANRFSINGGFLNTTTNVYGSPQISIVNGTFQIGSASVMSTHQSGATGARKYQVEIQAMEATNAMYIRSLNPGIGTGTDNEVVAISAHSVNTVGNRIGIFGMASNSATSNIGVKGEVFNNGAGYNVGGQFVVPTAATAYAIQLIDGSETTAGKFLRNMDTSGRARWANITPTDYKNSIYSLYGTSGLGAGLTASTSTVRSAIGSGTGFDSLAKDALIPVSTSVGFTGGEYVASTGTFTAPTTGFYQISYNISIGSATGWPATSSISAMVIDGINTGNYYMESRGFGSSYNPNHLVTNNSRTVYLTSGKAVRLRVLLNGTVNYTTSSSDILEMNIAFLGN